MRSHHTGGVVLRGLLEDSRIVSVNIAVGVLHVVVWVLLIGLVDKHNAEQSEIQNVNNLRQSMQVSHAVHSVVPSW
ncbi:hypothetical protein GOP47_0009240 [Adiantum capillus-veneris]|uniref:Uncharacterized protein n=1 Tax=Adiantum capillus-veneris TaxID=13818 RepID=A0A9D4UWI7_ADICA|nr:hypothetical protein GOP47_0009240 [Adiantum capillus-veneris]